jgi:uncharacterized membrane protein YjgN (DUF898 family)
MPPVALVALALIAGSGFYAVLDFFFSPAVSLAFVLLPILPWLRPGSLRFPQAASNEHDTVEVRFHLPIGLRARAASTALTATVIAGAVATHSEGRPAGSDCRLRLADGAEGRVTGWFEGGTGNEAGARPF